MTIELKNTSAPIYKFLVPSLGREMRFRPFLMRENKDLMIAHITEDPSTMVETLKTVIRSCCQDKIPVDDLALFDLEYLLCKIRSVSVGNTIQLNLDCDNASAHPDEASKNSVVTLNLDNVEVLGLKQFNPEVRLSDRLMLRLHPPKITRFESSEKRKDITPEEELRERFDRNMRILASCVEKIYTEDGVIDAGEMSENEIVAFFDELTMDQYGLLEQWFDRLPRCVIKVEWTCPVCGKRNVRYVRGLMNFFT